MRVSDDIHVGTLRGFDLCLVCVPRQSVRGNAGGKAGAGLPEGAGQQQTHAPGLACPPGLPLFPSRQAGSGKAGIRDRESGVPRIGGVHRPLPGQIQSSMNARVPIRIIVLMLAALGISGCVNVPPYDYTNYRAHPPRSILVLPPLNESTSVEGTYGYLSTVTEPIAERGYYVFPVAVIDQFMKDNGLPTPGEMQEAPLAKIVEVTGADAVLLLTLRQYGSQYHVVDSTTTVEVLAKLVDTRTGILLWQGRGFAKQ